VAVKIMDEWVKTVKKYQLLSNDLLIADITHTMGLLIANQPCLGLSRFKG
jgi:hypothetical protein